MKNNYISFIIFLLLFLVVLVFKEFFIITDTSAIIGAVFTMLGLIFNAWQITMTLDKYKDEKLEKLKDQLFEELDEVQKFCEKRDAYHDQRLDALGAKISDLSAHFTSHEKLSGHPDTHEQFLKIRNEISIIRASLSK